MNVLMVSTTFIPSVLLCGHCQLDYLEKQGKLNYKFVISHFINKKNIEWADIIVFLRSDSDIDAYVSKIAKKAGKHLIYVLDDDILNVPDYLSCAPYYYLPSTQNNIKTIMANCHTFLTTSPVLKEKYGHLFKKVFLINEPSINRIQNKEENDVVKIGFAGSIDRSQDINVLLKDAIFELVEKYGDSIQIEFMGARPDFIDELGLTYLPYQDGYDAYTAFMAKANWDIGLAPMPSTSFHRCKYFNKYVEYASFGIAGVYSNVEPYVYGIRDKENGLLVNNTTEEWVNAISSLIEDKKLRKSISDTSLIEANNIYSLDKLSYDYLEKLLVDYKEIPHQTMPDLTLVKSVIFVKRVYRKIAEQGLNFPAWLKQKLDKKYADYKEKVTDNKNKETIRNIIKNRKSCFVISPFYDERSDEYHKRVKYIDENYLNDSFNIYLSGEDRICEHLMVKIIDDNHASIVFNSFDIKQTQEVIELIESSGRCLVHSVTRFMREKISTDMFEILNSNKIKVELDTHGNIPEEYHEKKNFHTERVTGEIEEKFFRKADVLIVEDEKIRKTLEDKYGPFSGDFIYID